MARQLFEVDQLTVERDRRLRSVFDEDRPSIGDGVVGSSTNISGEGTGRKITPVVVEQLAGEFDDPDAFIGASEAIKEIFAVCLRDERGVGFEDKLNGARLCGA